MIPSRRARLRALGCGLVAVVVAFLVALPTLRGAGFDPTALARVDSATALGAAARAIDPSFHTVHPGAYDGQFYWAIGIDPLATGTLHAAVDKPSYRYGHPLYGWLAWLLSADNARLVAFSLILVGLASIVAAAALACLLGIARGSSGWEGLAVALNPGLASAAAHDLAEPLAAALLLAAFTARARGRFGVALVALALLPLAKEPLALVACVIAVWEGRRGSARRAALAAAALLPALAWWVIARLRFGAWFTSGDSALGRPLGGWWTALARGEVDRHASHAAHAAALAALAALLAVCLSAAWRALSQPEPLALTYLVLVAVALCLAPNATAEVSTALRNTAFVLVLAPFVLGSARSGARAVRRAAPVAG